MKKTITTIANLLIITLIFAQSPEKMSYQAVIRNVNGGLVKNQAVGMQISILQGTADGTPVYVESQTPASNANGLVSIEIGSADATVVSGDFSAIDWANGPYFIKTETDPAGGTSYTISGTSQLLSVPYALHAKTAENIFSGNYSDLSNAPDLTGIAMNTQAIKDTASNIRADIPDVSSLATESALADTAGQIRDDLTPRHYIGEYVEGGIVFYVDRTGKHGLVVATEDQATAAPWGQRGIAINAFSTWDGEKNSEIVAASALTGDAVKLALEYNFLEFDWYLPSIDELNLLYNARYEVNKTLNKYDSEMVGIYWSSTATDNASAAVLYFIMGSSNGAYKSNHYYVRAIHKF